MICEFSFLYALSAGDGVSRLPWLVGVLHARVALGTRCAMVALHVRGGLR